MKYFAVFQRDLPGTELCLQQAGDLPELKAGKLFGAAAPDVFHADVGASANPTARRLLAVYTSPALIAEERFVADLRGVGLDNFELRPVSIHDGKQKIAQYSLINVIGRVSCADWAASRGEIVGGVSVMYRPVIEAGRARDLDLFLLHEDVAWLVLSERVHEHLRYRGYDLHFEELAVS